MILRSVHQDQSADSLALNEAAALLFSFVQLSWGSHCRGCVVYGVMLLLDQYGELEVLERPFISNIFEVQRCHNLPAVICFSATSVNDKPGRSCRNESEIIQIIYVCTYDIY